MIIALENYRHNMTLALDYDSFNLDVCDAETFND